MAERRIHINSDIKCIGRILFYRVAMNNEENTSIVIQAGSVKGIQL